jgi:hypothetical protein
LSRNICKIDPKVDWFDHEKYIKETLPMLKAIKPPSSIRCIVKKDDDLMIIEEDTKPRLVPEKPKFFMQKVTWLLIISYS